MIIEPKAETGGSLKTSYDELKKRQFDNRLSFSLRNIGK